jgi:predicted 3-demethylubiquinone-9 3-methyltransferase (glyoxalase superfamily)
VPSLLFVGGKCGIAEEAMDSYTSVFRRLSPGELSRHGPDRQPNRVGSVMYGDCVLEGQRFAVMDSALDHPFDLNEAISFIINCGDQAEVDYSWDRLSAVPEAEACGWLKDRYGVSWPVVPWVLYDLMRDSDTEKRERVVSAMLQMKKLDIESLVKAFENQ